MSDEGGPLIDFGGLAKPATVLIEKISDAVGAIALPWQIVRVATAEAEAEKIRAATDIEVSEMQRRALGRLVQEEGRRQENIEKITVLAIEDLQRDAKPQDVERDWLV